MQHFPLKNGLIPPDSVIRFWPIFTNNQSLFVLFAQISNILVPLFLADTRHLWCVACVSLAHDAYIKTNIKYFQIDKLNIEVFSVICAMENLVIVLS